ncbi:MULTISPECIES: hypothetical protein [Rhodopseudomonas]|uniref:hypothetical protein n=1 Tax=Rhodopseudomonas TaxID=1073 RepID=UPI000A730B97|nr:MULTISPECIES: hypothetical protein [Rhodopseudomonas]MDF3810914.1 hypothetical protein [Rhodopseudomonas sp. BAL398]WOK19885.1 hypothetical protein RBJ75_10350 [Rhodopseudomonas sp. BAL398]
MFIASLGEVGRPLYYISSMKAPSGAPMLAPPPWPFYIKEVFLSFRVVSHG